MDRLALAYENAYREKDPHQMKEHLHTFKDCVWMYENSVGEFKRIALMRAIDYLEDFAQFKWMFKQLWKYLFVERISKKIKDTIRDIKWEIESVRRHRN